MHLNDLFERVYVINLPFKADRQERLIRHFDEVDIVKSRHVRWERAICGDWTPAPPWWGAGNGAWGCLMSHVRIAQDAVHDSVASYCVLEDDVVFHPKASEMLSCVAKELPANWDQFYLGGQFLHRRPAQVSPWIVNPYNVNRTHAFALSKDVIPRFLQHVMHAPDYFDVKVGESGQTSLEHNHFHIDHQIGRAHERNDWNTYAPTWWLAGQEAGSSNISGRVTKRMWWHWRDRGHQLPFFFLGPNPSTEEKALAARYIHAGNNLLEGTFIDIGINEALDDEGLKRWLHMIAGEAVETWLLPGFEVPPQFPDLAERVRGIWEAGLLNVSGDVLEAVSDYPFNGFFGGAPRSENGGREFCTGEKPGLETDPFSSAKASPRLLS